MSNRTDSHAAGKVLIAGPATYGTLEAIARAFERLGWRAELRCYRFVTSTSRQKLWRLIQRLRLHNPWEQVLYNRFLDREVWPSVAAADPNLLLFVRPFTLTVRNRRLLRSNCTPTITWMTDSLARYGRYAGPWPEAVRNYVFDGADERPGLSTWLPLGFDDEQFRPGEQRRWDVLFVGRLFVRNYNLRRLFFERLLDWKDLSRYRVAWVGHASRQLSGLVHRAKQRSVTLLGELDMAALASAIAASRISILVHQDDGSQPVNPLFFAIPGCRSCLVTDRRDYLQRWLVPQCEYVPADLDELHSVLSPLTTNAHASATVAEQGWRAAQQHTWLQRVKTLLTDSGMPSCPDQ
jgi:hypothetical protein